MFLDVVLIVGIVTGEMEGDGMEQARVVVRTEETCERVLSWVRAGR